LKVQLLYFPGCPHVGGARHVLTLALAACALTDVVAEELDVEAATCPPELRSWGSPTILVNGRDVAGEEAPTGPSCRLYPGGEPPGVPPQRLIEDKLREALRT
jgi:mercuric ion transport protein